MSWFHTLFRVVSLSFYPITWTFAQTLNYSHQIAFKVPYQPTVVEVFCFPLM